MIDRVDTLMKENGIDLYRQDFRSTPCSSGAGATAGTGRELPKIFMCRDISPTLTNSCAGTRKWSLTRVHRAAAATTLKR